MIIKIYMYIYIFMRTGELRVLRLDVDAEQAAQVLVGEDLRRWTINGGGGAEPEGGRVGGFGVTSGKLLTL